MKKLITLIVIVLFVVVTCSECLLAQVAINEDGSPADGTAMLDVKSTNKGVLISRMTETDRLGLQAPANGLLV